MPTDKKEVRFQDGRGNARRGRGKITFSIEAYIQKMGIKTPL